MKCEVEEAQEIQSFYSTPDDGGAASSGCRESHQTCCECVISVYERSQDLSQTYGERAVGLSFNPSADPMVDEVKRLYARIIDLCVGGMKANADNLGAVRLYEIAVKEAQGAQMWAVKAITWKE